MIKNNDGLKSDLEVSQESVRFTENLDEFGGNQRNLKKLEGMCGSLNVWLGELGVGRESHVYVVCFC